MARGDLEVRYAEVLDAGRPAAVAYQHGRGKLTARERVELLADPDSFLEYGALARPKEQGADGLPIYADGVITGTATLAGELVAVVSSDFTAAGGSNGTLGNEKLARLWSLAADGGFPVVMFLEGGGHRIQEGLDSYEFARGVDILGVQLQLARWVPTVAVVVGPAWGAATVIASLCDLVIAVRGKAQLGMAPPSLVAAATGEQVDAETLGGADAQARNGLVHIVVDDESEAVAAVRNYLGRLPAHADLAPPDAAAVSASAAAAEALDTVVPHELRRAHDMRQVIAGLVDEASGLELRRAYAGNLITSLARIEGRSVGIIANQPAVRAGTLDAVACEKAAQFISLCDAFGIGLLYLMDMPGFMVGTTAERSGLARDAGSMLAALGAATVPRYTVIVRKGYGAAYLAMSGGRSFSPELVIAWPTAQTAAMAVESAVDVAYRRDVEAAPDPAAKRLELTALFRSQLDALRAAEGFGVDLVALPSQTRRLLAQAMSRAPRRRSALQQGSGRR